MFKLVYMIVIFARAHFGADFAKEVFGEKEQEKILVWMRCVFCILLY